eukprot:3980734-Pyramimonas_sp.AAC.1
MRERDPQAFPRGHVLPTATPLEKAPTNAGTLPRRGRPRSMPDPSLQGVRFRAAALARLRAPGLLFGRPTPAHPKAVVEAACPPIELRHLGLPSL